MSRQRTFGAIKWGGGLFLGLAGLIWLANLPNPMIRWSVTKTFPPLLLPSYISMEQHYRQAIALSEQSDQLINHPTSYADFGLGTEKVKQAQKHLEALPVWSLGYYPQFYCQWANCSWRFSLDEFKALRANVARMEAKIFQEENAQTALEAAEQTLNQAKHQYQQATTTEDKDQARDAWQAAIDRIKQVPAATLAGDKARSQIVAYERDFEQVAGTTLIAAAQQFAIQAEKLQQKPPQTPADWKQVQNLWQEAINRLNQIPLKDPGYLQAQRLLATYQTNLDTAQNHRLSNDGMPANSLIAAAKQFALQADESAQNPPHPVETWQQIANLWKEAIDRLKHISVNDANYLAAQKLLANYQANLGIVESKLKAERESGEALDRANAQIANLLASASNDAKGGNRDRSISQIQTIITQLGKVQKGTSAYPEAQELIQSAQGKLKQLKSQK